eukprot:c28446_g1_i3 orf=509-5821(-)
MSGMAFIAVLEADLRALSLEARRKYPAVKDAAEHAILKLRSLPDPTLIAQSDHILRIFLTACECKSVKLSAIGLACLQKLIAHGAVDPAALPDILAVLKEHADMNDESVQLKTLQTILTIFQSQLHPENEDSMAIALGICLRLLENSRNPDSVHSTAAATLRQAVALIFDRVVTAESLPISNVATNRRTSRSNSVSGDVSRSMIAAKAVEFAIDTQEQCSPAAKEQMSQAARLGLRLFEDLTALAAGGSAAWLNVPFLQRTFALDIIEYVLSNYVSIFKKLGPYQSVLRYQVCSLLMTSLRTTGELEGEIGEPSFRRLVLRSVANVIRLYSSILVTECEVFLSMLVKSINLDLPLWHRIMVLEVLRGFCVEARILRLLFQTFDMRPENTDVVAGMIKSLARVVTSVQVPDASEESLAAVAGMFNSKAKGVEWSMEYDASGVAVMVASEAHAITLAVEGLLGVVFTVATLTDEAIDAGQLDSPRCESNFSSDVRKAGELASICTCMVNVFWQTLLDALSLILSRSQGEAIVLEILKGYQAFTQACGVLRAVEPLNNFLASLCKFALIPLIDVDKSSGITGAVVLSGKRMDQTVDQRDVVLTPKNVQALRTIFNIAHRLDSVLGQSWILVLETLASLDRIIHSPHATTQEVSAVVPRSSHETGNQSSDFNILSTLDSQLFESSAYMSTSAVCSLLTALRQISNDSLIGVASGLGQALPGSSTAVSSSVSASMPQLTPKLFALERMFATLVNNLHRAELLWDQITAHLLELAEHESPQVRNVALDVLDRSICAVLGCECIRMEAAILDPQEGSCMGTEIELRDFDTRLSLIDGQQNEANRSCLNNQESNFRSDAFECTVILPLRTLYSFGQSMEVRGAALKILSHVLARYGEKLYHSWPDILELLRSVANTSEKDLLPLGFQSVRVVMNDGLLSIPVQALDTCIEVAGAYGAQRTDINISLTAIGLLWTTSDIFARCVNYEIVESKGSRRRFSDGAAQPSPRGQYQTTESEARILGSESLPDDLAAPFERRLDMDCDRLLLAVFGVIQGLGTDERPEVRNSAIRTLFQSTASHGHKLSITMWEQCLWNLIFPLLETVRHLAATSSKDEWQGKELGIQGGKLVHMLVHHSRNTAQKQWDETLVLLLSGMSRLLRPFFQFLLTLDNFRKGWDSLLQFIQESITNGSKEVAFAAVNSLHTVLLHASKASIPIDYFEAAFAIYETAIQNASHYESRVVAKARQELLHNLGELYVQAYSMFKPTTYLRMLTLIDLLAHHPINSIDSSAVVQGSLPLVQRTVLEVLPMIKPLNGQLQSQWPIFLRQLLTYLPGGDQHACSHCKVPESLNVMEQQQMENTSGKTEIGLKVTCIGADGQGMLHMEEINGNAPEGKDEWPPIQQQDSEICASDITIGGISSTRVSLSEEGPMPQSSFNTSFSKASITDVLAPVFSECIISILLDLQSWIPACASEEVLPEIISALGRCMSTRRDFPNNSLWRTAVGAFNQILSRNLFSVNITKQPLGQDGNELCSGSGRPRFWKDLTDVCETFLVGACGRAVTVPAEGIQQEILQADELLETNVLDVICNKLLKFCKDAPLEIIERFIDVLDRCASRTSTLPLENVELLPAHCSHFSLVCLQKLFEICRCGPEDSNLSSELTVSKAALPALLKRCDFILCQYSKDENEHGDAPLPSVRTEEVIFVLQELARLTLHPSQFDLCRTRNYRLQYPELHTERAHLIILYGPLCELVISRQTRVHELLLVLFRLLGSEMGLIRDFYH